MANQNAKKLYWSKTPFFVPKTEEIKDDYNREGLQDGIVYLTPVNGKKSKQGKPAFEQPRCNLEILHGYIKNEHIFFQPQNADKFHGEVFAFNRPDSESKEEQVKQQERLLTEWSQHHCICVIDCREHHQLNQLAKDFDGWFLKTGTFTIITESVEHDKLPENEKQAYVKFVERVQNGEDIDTLQEEMDEEIVPLVERGLFLPLAQSNERLYTISAYRNVFSTELLAENKPKEKPNLEEFAKNFNAPSQQSSNNKGGGYKGGGAKQITPQEKSEFVKEVLKESGFDTSSLGSIVQQALANTSSWYTMQLAVTLATGGGVPSELPSSMADEGEHTSSEKQNKTSTDNYSELIAWCKEREEKESYFGQKLDKVTKGEVKHDEEQAGLLLELLNKYDITKPNDKKTISEKVGKTLNAKFTVFDLNTEQLQYALS